MCIRDRFLSQQGFDGVLLRLDDYTSADRITVKVVLHTADGHEVIIPTMPAYPLIERADFRGGGSLGATYEAQNRAAAATETEDVSALGAFIELGHLELSGDDELEIEVAVTSALSASGAVRVSAIDLGLRPENPVRIVEKSQGVANYSYPSEVYCYRTVSDTDENAVWDIAVGALTLNVKAGQRAYNFDARDLWAFNCSFGQHEGEGPRRTLCCYLDGRLANPSGDYSLSLAGTDRTNFSTFGVERLLMPDRSAKKAVEVRQAFSSGVEKALASKPDAVRALRIQGKV